MQKKKLYKYIFLKNKTAWGDVHELRHGLKKNKEMSTVYLSLVLKTEIKKGCLRNTFKALPPTGKSPLWKLITFNPN